MSATQDKSQKIKFIHSNLYQIHGNQEPKKSEFKPTAEVKTSVSPAKSSAVLKAGDLNQGPLAAILVKRYQAAQLEGKRIDRPAGLPPSVTVSPTIQSQNSALKDLKQNLKTLNDLHARLRFMLQELEDLVKE